MLWFSVQPLHADRTAFQVPRPSPYQTLPYDCLMQAELAWQRGRHHIRVRPHALLQAATAARTASSATFSFSPSARQLAFLWEYQLCGTAFLPLGALLEMGAAAAAASSGDGNGGPQARELIVMDAAVTSLAQCSSAEEAAGAPAVLCSLLHDGQLQLATGPSLQLCFTAQLGCSHATAAGTSIQTESAFVKVSSGVYCTVSQSMIEGCNELTTCMPVLVFAGSAATSEPAACGNLSAAVQLGTPPSQGSRWLLVAASSAAGSHGPAQ